MLIFAEFAGAHPQALGHQAPEDSHLPHLWQVLYTGNALFPCLFTCLSASLSLGLSVGRSDSQSSSRKRKFVPFVPSVTFVPSVKCVPLSHLEHLSRRHICGIYLHTLETVCVDVCLPTVCVGVCLPTVCVGVCLPTVCVGVCLPTICVGVCLLCVAVSTDCSSCSFNQVWRPEFPARDN